MSPEHKRRAVSAVLKAGLCSLRRACRYLGLGRSSYFYEPTQRNGYEKLLVDRIIALSKEEPTYGYRFITELLHREGWRVNRKKVQRIRRAEGLIATQPKKKARRNGTSTTACKQRADAISDVWSWDFIFDTTEEGKSIKILSIVDEYSRFCIALEVERKINGESVSGVLDRVCKAYGTPRHIRSDNGPEFVAELIREWIQERKIGAIYIEPGSPWQNPYVESFHSRFRMDYLNREWFINLLDAKVGIADWREKYNNRRPHSGLNYRSPAEVFFAEPVPKAQTHDRTDIPSQHSGALPPNPRDLSHYRLPAGQPLREAGSTRLPDLPYKHCRGRSGCIPAEPYPPKQLDQSIPSIKNLQSQKQPCPANI